MSKKKRIDIEPIEDSIDKQGFAKWWGSQSIYINVNTAKIIADVEKDITDAGGKFNLSHFVKDRIEKVKN